MWSWSACWTTWNLACLVNRRKTKKIEVCKQYKIRFLPGFLPELPTITLVGACSRRLGNRWLELRDRNSTQLGPKSAANVEINPRYLLDFLPRQSAWFAGAPGPCLLQWLKMTTKNGTCWNFKLNKYLPGYLPSPLHAYWMPSTHACFLLRPKSIKPN
jgi:hypothetical protein